MWEHMHPRVLAAIYTSSSCPRWDVGMSAELATASLSTSLLGLLGGLHALILLVVETTRESTSVCTHLGWYEEMY